MFAGRATGLVALLSVGLSATSAVELARAGESLLERDVLPILTKNCLGCHGGLKQEGGLDLRTLERPVRRELHEAGGVGGAVGRGDYDVAAGPQVERAVGDGLQAVFTIRATAEGDDKIIPAHG